MRNPLGTKWKRVLGGTNSVVGTWYKLAHDFLRNRFSCYESWQAPAATLPSRWHSIVQQWSLKKRLVQLAELILFAEWITKMSKIGWWQLHDSLQRCQDFLIAWNRHLQPLSWILPASGQYQPPSARPVWAPQRDASLARAIHRQSLALVQPMTPTTCPCAKGNTEQQADILSLCALTHLAQVIALSGFGWPRDVFAESLAHWEINASCACSN